MKGLTDIAGLSVGHHTDPRRPTGCTVVLCERGVVCGVDVRGGAPGTRETDLLDPTASAQVVHAIVLAGGSAFGLDAASGVVRWLDERGIGLAVGPALAGGAPVTVPIVPAAILFDLWIGDPRIRPDADSGYAACDAASSDAIAEGSIGAGAGATVGKLFGIDGAMRGGLGSASIEAGGITVAALVAVNALGDVVDPASGRIVAGALRNDGSGRFRDTAECLRRGEWPAPWQLAEADGTATTLAVIATDAVLDKAACSKVAQMAHDGLARTIVPIHTAGDGDTVFALATGTSLRAVHPSVVGSLAADVLAEAVLRAVRAATSLVPPGLPSLPSAGDRSDPVVA